MSAILCSLVLVAVSAIASVAQAIEAPTAGDRALPCRPTIACTADIVPPGTFEVEAGYLVRDLAGGALQQGIPVLLKLTLTPMVQLQVASNGPILQRQTVYRQYLDDIELGGKVRFNDQTTFLPSFAVSGALSIPTFPAANYLRTYDLLFTGYATKDIGWLHADLNVGFNLWRIQAPLPQAFGALALSAAATSLLTGMVEAYYFTDADPVAVSDGGILAALAVSPLSWLVFDAGADLGLVTRTRRFSLFVGVTVIPCVFFDATAARDGAILQDTHSILIDH